MELVVLICLISILIGIEQYKVRYCYGIYINDYVMGIVPGISELADQHSMLTTSYRVTNSDKSNLYSIDPTCLSLYGICCLG